MKGPSLNLQIHTARVTLHVLMSAHKYQIRYHRQIKGLLPNLQIQTARANSYENVLISLNTNVDTVLQNMIASLPNL